MNQLKKTNQLNQLSQPNPFNQNKLTELEHLTICYQRGLLTTPKEQQHFFWLQSGGVGEDRLVALLTKHLPNNWHILRNVWLEINGNRTEVDTLIIAPKFWWAVEVKNYNGKFEYRNQICYLNQQHFPDKIAPCRNRQRILKLIAAKLPYDIPEIDCSLVFIDERCQVESDPLDDIQLVMNYQLPWHIDNQLQRHRELNHTISQKDSLATLANYTIDNPFQPKVLSLTAFDDATKGIRCIACNRYNIKVQQYNVTCHDCSHTITKTEAVLQAAGELGTLFYTQPRIITTHNLYEFIGGKISKKGIRSILKTNVRKYGSKRYTYYENPGFPYQNS